MVRRPLLEPNLSASGLTFACAAMLVFLMSNVIAPPPNKSRRLRRLARPSDKRPASKPRRRYRRDPQAAGTGLSPVSRLLQRIGRPRQAGHGHHRPPRRRAGDGADRLSAFRQHAHGHCRGDPVFVVALHGQFHAADRSRRAGGAAGLGDPIVPPARGCRHSRRAGGGTDLVSALSSAAVVFVLLAAGTAPLQPGGARRAGARGGIAGVHAVQPGDVYGPVLPDLRPDARAYPQTSAVSGRTPWRPSAGR